MAIKWTVSTVERTLSDPESGLSNICTVLHWQAIDSQIVGEGDEAEPHSGRCYGAVALAAPDPEAFTPYADIKEADAVAWAKAALGEEQCNAYEASIAAQIDESLNPTNATGVPWNE